MMSDAASLPLRGGMEKKLIPVEEFEAKKEETIKVLKTCCSDEFDKKLVTSCVERMINEVSERKAIVLSVEHIKNNPKFTMYSSKPEEEKAKKIAHEYEERKGKVLFSATEVSEKLTAIKRDIFRIFSLTKLTMPHDSLLTEASDFLRLFPHLLTSAEMKQMYTDDIAMLKQRIPTNEQIIDKSAGNENMTQKMKEQVEKMKEQVEKMKKKLSEYQETLEQMEQSTVMDVGHIAAAAGSEKQSANLSSLDG